MTAPHILIVGAGPTGLTTAVELARRGIMPVVIEKRKTASNLSRAVGILPHSMALLKPSGVAQTIQKEAIELKQVIIHEQNKIIANISICDEPDPNDRLFGLAQDRTEQHLLTAFEKMGGHVNYGAEFLSLSQSDTGISVSILGKAFRFDYVIGADGAHSTIRQTLRIPFNGHDLPETWSIADVEAKNWKNASCFQGFILDNGGISVVVPLENKRFRVIANHPDALQALPVPMEVTKLRRASQFKISVRQAETYQMGRVFLAGDAAHCHSPAGGRGMNLGIADAAELAKRIANGTTDGYHAARHPIGKATLRQSERIRHAMSSAHPTVRFIVRNMLRLAQRIAPLRQRFVKNLLDI